MKKGKCPLYNKGETELLYGPKLGTFRLPLVT
jgi:hypothetical protein